MIILALSACQPAAPLSTPPSASSTLPAPAVTASSSSVRTCDYVPGKSTPAQIPPASSQPADNPSATPMTFNPNPVDAATSTSELAIFNLIVKDITDDYFSPDYNGVDWNSIQQKYKTLVQNGLKQADFYLAMSQMVSELGDNASSYLNPSDQATQTAASNSDWVGIGVSYMTLNESGQDFYVINWVYSGSPAEQAGLKSHDVLLKVDGGPFQDENGTPRALGPAGTTVTVTVQTPGQAPRDVKLVRSRITNPPSVDDCLVAGTAIGYIRWEDINNNNTIDETIEALKKMSAGSPLQGLIIDLRQSSDPYINNIQPLASLFTSGNLGSFISLRSNSVLETLTASPSDISGSQKLPLVVLQDQGTSGAPLSTGVLQLNDHARLVGQIADGRVYAMWCDDYTDGSTLCLAHGVFQPAGKIPDYWKKTGIVPDVLVDGRWDQYTEANDPYLAKAIDLLMQK